MASDDNLLDDLDLDFTRPELEGPPATQPDAKAPPKDLAGHYFGPFELLSRIGEGGVAQVHRARHIHPQYAERPIALKVLHERLHDDEHVRAMFRREASILSLIKHRNVVETYEAGLQNGTLYLAMEFVDGKDLENFLWRAEKLGVQLPLGVALFVISEVLRALSYAHELKDLTEVPLGLVHRDVNPANVFLSFDGVVKLGDFGVTSLRAGTVQRSREVAGKVGYFAPEQLRNDAFDARADIYAVGAMLFEVIAKKRLFVADDPKEALRLNLKGEIPDLAALAPDCPASLVTLVQQALMLEASERPASAAALLHRLLPFVPERATAQLMLRSLMRHVFVAEHQSALTLKSQAPAALSHAGNVLDVFIADPTVQQAVCQLLSRRGYSVRAYSSAEALGAAPGLAPALATIWDVGLLPTSLEMRPPVRSHRGTVALGLKLDATAVERALALGASDLVFRPMSEQRLLNAVRAVGSETPEPSAEATLMPRPRQRTLLAAPQNALISATRQALESLGHTAVWTETLRGALAEVERQSFELMVIWSGWTAAEITALIAQIRGHGGMGTTPVLILGSRERWMVPSLLPERAATVSLEEDQPEPKAVARALKAGIIELSSKAQGGQMRLFRRFILALPVALRFGGRVFQARSINLSRGGLLLETLQLPSIGTPLGIELALPFGEMCRAQGVAMRVVLGQSEQVEVVHVGVAFTGFVGDSEARLIHFISQLSQGR